MYDKEIFIMANVINYQLSMFGKYNIIPSPDIISVLMKEINAVTKEIFLPNIINSQQIEIPTNKIVNVTNLAFITQDRKYSITVLNDRIDVNYTKVDDKNLEMHEFYSLAIDVFSAISKCDNIISNRLAMNIEQVCEVESFSSLETKGRLLLQCPEYYKSKKFVEWGTHINSQIDIDINHSKETLNVITDISSAQNLITQKAGVLFHIDINTILQNQNMRFEVKSLEIFVNNAQKIAKELTMDVERLIVSE